MNGKQEMKEKEKQSKMGQNCKDKKRGAVNVKAEGVGVVLQARETSFPPTLPPSLSFSSSLPLVFSPSQSLWRSHDRCHLHNSPL